MQVHILAVGLREDRYVFKYIVLSGNYSIGFLITQITSFELDI